MYGHPSRKMFRVPADEDVDVRHLKREVEVRGEPEVGQRDHHVHFAAVGKDLCAQQARVVVVVHEDAVERVLVWQVVESVVARDEPHDADAHAADLGHHVRSERRAAIGVVHVGGEDRVRAHRYVAEERALAVREVVIADGAHVDGERLGHLARGLTHRAEVGDAPLLVVVARVEHERRWLLLL